MPIQHYAILAAVIMIWGVNFLFMKFGLNEVTPMVLGMLRFFCVLIPAIFILKKPKTKWHLLVLYGLTISFGQFSFMFLALSINFPTGLAALILQAQVFLTVLFASFLLNEPVKTNHIIGMISAGLGLVLIGIGQYQGNLSLIGMLPVLAAALSWACGNIIVKKIGQVDALSLVVWGSLSTFCAFTLGSLLLYGADGIMVQLSHLTYKGIIGFLFLSYVASLVGYTGWGYLLARHSASKVTPFIMLVPVIALIVGYLFLNETLGIWHWFGIVTVLVGLSIHMLGGRWFNQS